jgi:hypothetical protein
MYKKIFKNLDKISKILGLRYQISKCPQKLLKKIKKFGSYAPIFKMCSI